MALIGQPLFAASISLKLVSKDELSENGDTGSLQNQGL